MHIALAPIKLKSGVTEEQLISASAEFQRDFVEKQTAVTRRILVRDAEGGFADIVFFTDADAMAGVLAAEENDPACARFMSLMDDDGSFHVYEAVADYE